MVKCTLGKIDSIILFVTYHSFKKHSPYYTHPHVSICEFLKPYELLFLEFESFVKCKI